MGNCTTVPHMIFVTVEELVLDAPYEKEIIRGTPVVYLKQKQPNNVYSLLTFTTNHPTVVDISCVWNQIRWFELYPQDPEDLYVVVGENPRYRGCVPKIRDVNGEVQVEICDWDGKKNMGTVGVLTISVNQTERPPEPIPLPVHEFHRPGFETNLSVFLYEAKNVDKRLLECERNQEDSSKFNVNLDLLIHSPHDDIRTPTTITVDADVLETQNSVNLVWNEGFHWTNLTEEPRFLDIRLNSKEDEFNKRAVARIDLWRLDVWNKGSDWKWHPLLLDERKSHADQHILVIDDTDSAKDVEHQLKVLGYPVTLETDFEGYLQRMTKVDFEGLENYVCIFVALRKERRMDAISLVQTIRDKEAAAQMEPAAIIATDEPDDNSNLDRDRRALQAYGFDDVLYKPLEKGDVRWVLSRYVRNSGTILVDVVVQYAPIGDNTNLANAMDKTVGTSKTAVGGNLAKKLRSALAKARAELRGSMKSQSERMSGVLELRIQSLTLTTAIPENYTLVYIITMNHQVIETKKPKRANHAPIAKDTLLEFNEEVRIWVGDLNEKERVAEDEDEEPEEDVERKQQPMNLGIAVYAYPLGAHTWRAEDLIGQWSTSDPQFWTGIDNEYAAHMCILTKPEIGNKIKKRGFLEMTAIVRPAAEIVKRQMHDAVQRSCLHDGSIGRGELDRMVSGLFPIMRDPKHSEADEDVGGDELEAHTAGKDAVPLLTSVSRFVKDAAHYTPNGQFEITESHFNEMVDLQKMGEIVSSRGDLMD